MKTSVKSLVASTALVLVMAAAATSPAFATPAVIDISAATDAQTSVTTAITGIGAVVVAIMMAFIGFKIAPWAISQISRMFGKARA